MPLPIAEGPGLFPSTLHWQDRCESGTVFRMPLLLAMTLLLAPPPGYKRALNEGRRLTKAGEYAKAVAAFDIALIAEPKDARAMSGRGFAHLQSGDTVAAKRDFEQALKWAKKAKLQRMIRHNLKLASRPPACTASLDGGVEKARTFPGWKALYLGLIEDGMELLDEERPGTDQAARTAACSDGCKTAGPSRHKAGPWVIEVGGMGTSTFHVTRPGPDGALIVSNTLAEGVPEDQCWRDPSVGILGADNGILHVSVAERVINREVVNDPDMGGVGVECTLESVSEIDIFLNAETLEVLLRVERMQTGAEEKPMPGGVELDGAKVTVSGCGPTRTTTLPITVKP